MLAPPTYRGDKRSHCPRKADLEPRRPPPMVIEKRSGYFASTSAKGADAILGKAERKLYYAAPAGTEWRHHHDPRGRDWRR